MLHRRWLLPHVAGRCRSQRSQRAAGQHQRRRQSALLMRLMTPTIRRRNMKTMTTTQTASTTMLETPRATLATLRMRRHPAAAASAAAAGGPAGATDNERQARCMSSPTASGSKTMQNRGFREQRPPYAQCPKQSAGGLICRLFTESLPGASRVYSSPITNGTSRSELSSIACYRLRFTCL